MNILIIGAGVVGTALAEQLSQEGHRVVVVDRDRSKVQDLNARFDVLAVHGSGSRLSVLHKAGVESAELVIAVTDVDEVNIVVGMMAAKLGVKHRIVRVRNREFAEGTGVLSLKELGIDHVINPDPAIVNTLVRMIDLPGAVDVASLSGGQVLMLGFDISEDSPAANRTPAELREAGDLDAFLILDIQRGDEVFVAKGHHRLLPGDNIHVLAAAPTVPFVLPILHRHPRQTRRVIIVGASRIGLALALAIEKRIDRVVLIEPDGAQAHEAADLLSMTTVLRGTGTDLAILEEAAVDTCDLFCALSDDDQRNMLAALLARKHGAAHTAVVVHQPEFVPVLESLGVETVISPRLVTVGETLMHVRKGTVLSVTRLAGSRGEIVELVAQEGSPLVRSALKDLPFPDNALVGAVVRDGVMQIPTGNTRIMPGERVMVYAMPDAIPKVEKMFAGRMRA